MKTGQKIIAERIDALQKIMGFSHAEKKLLLQPAQVKKTTLKIDGEDYPAWRIIHSQALGPGKGGIRFHPGVCEDEVRSLAFWMALKNSLAGIPYGGAKGGVKLNPKEKSEKELQKISRAYIDAFYKYIGQDKDIPAPDVYTNPQIMAWMLDEFEKKTGQHEPGVITGKPVELGGLALRSDSTARGGFIIIKELLHHIEKMPKNPTVAIQGFGNAGANIARMLSGDGFKILAVSDSQGGIYNEDGLDIISVINLKGEGKTVAEAKGKKISNEELLELPVDILVLAALENQITAENADKIMAKNIVELANGPVDFEADQILSRKKILVVPDILANAGGVIVSYFEWAQNKAGNLFEEDYLKKKLFDIMERAWHLTYELYKDKGNIDLRTSAYILAVKRILAAEKLRGKPNE